MRRIPKVPRPAQLELFREPAVTPAWEQLPRDAGQRAQWLLARLLRPTRVRPNAVTIASALLFLSATGLVAFGGSSRIARVHSRASGGGVGRASEDAKNE